MYWVCVFISELHVEEEQEYENYLRITPDELLVLVKDDITE